ncbi:kinase-like protein [Rhizophagus irregularis]|uniref:Kinase-like protein n=1 Tax=Rhizophagus irregularis TaxID=588596 RepID=A0A2N1NL49_9GLOM|nr:kinase-like protein [Rhizophagus irregularis]
MQVVKNSNEWFEEFISKNYIKYHEYKDFHNIKKIGTGTPLRKVYQKYFVLKLVNINNITIKEIINELEFHCKINSENIIRFFGITNEENQNSQLERYFLFIEHADNNSLQNYLKENFKILTWEDKCKLAYQLVCAVSYLHNEGIANRNLHSDNILIHRHTIKLADFGLSKRIKKVSGKRESDLFVNVPYVDPKKFVDSINLKQSYSLNKKSDVYSIGVLLWEISSGRPPFKDELYDVTLATRIIHGYREIIVPNTPVDYSNIYTECWNYDPDNRPDMNQVVVKLEEIITLAEDHHISSINDNSLYENFIHNFNKLIIKEMEPYIIQNINENVFEEDLSVMIDELIELYLKELNIGKETNVRKQLVLNYFKNYKINLQEIYNWLLNNQNNSNSIYLLGYFNYHGIETNINKKKAFELYQKAGELENVVAQYYLTIMYMDGEGVDKNYEKSFELSKKLTERKYPCGINSLGYCYYCEIGTNVDIHKAFELYQMAANLGNLRAQCNLALMYRDGEGVEINYNKVFELSKKSADGEYSGGMNMLGYCYSIGIGTNINQQKAFELYKKAAYIGYNVAQYNLATMYEYGNGIKEDKDKAIYWYKKSLDQGYQKSQNKLNKLLKE